MLLNLCLLCPNFILFFFNLWVFNLIQFVHEDKEKCSPSLFPPALKLFTFCSDYLLGSSRRKGDLNWCDMAFWLSWQFFWP